MRFCTHHMPKVKLSLYMGNYIVIEASLLNFSLNTYSKTCLKQPLSKRPKIGFQEQLSLIAGQKYCRMLQGCILQYFRPPLSYHLSLRSLFHLF